MSGSSGTWRHGTARRGKFKLGKPGRQAFSTFWHIVPLRQFLFKFARTRDQYRQLLCPAISPGGLNSDHRWRYSSLVVKSPFVNVEEQIAKVVGRRTKTGDAFRSGMPMQSLAVELHRSLKHRWAPKGVYRFKTHQEADEWMNRMLARSQKT
jgi:hypothetical protein